MFILHAFGRGPCVARNFEIPHILDSGFIQLDLNTIFGVLVVRWNPGLQFAVRGLRQMARVLQKNFFSILTGKEYQQERNENNFGVFRGKKELPTPTRCVQRQCQMNVGADGQKTSWFFSGQKQDGAPEVLLGRHTPQSWLLGRSAARPLASVRAVFA